MTPNPRAFTVVEVLLATALLAILAAASAGLLRDAARLSQPDGQRASPSAEAIVLLGLYADLVLEDPETVALTASPEQAWDGARIDTSSFDLLLSEQSMQTPFLAVRIRVVPDPEVVEQADEQPSNAWLVFGAIDQSDRIIGEVARRIRLYKQEDRP